MKIFSKELLINNLTTTDLLPVISGILKVSDINTLLAQLETYDQDRLANLWMIANGLLADEEYENAARAFFTGSTEEVISAWLIDPDSFEFGILPGKNESGNADAIVREVEQLPTEHFNKFKRALTQSIEAMVNNDQILQKLPAFYELTIVAAHLRVSEITPHLITFFQDWSQQMRKDTDQNWYHGQIMSVLVGFIDLTPAQIVPIIKHWFEQKHPDFLHNGAQFMLTLCKVDPENFPSYLSTFLEINQLDGYWNQTMIYIKLGLIDMIGLDRAKARLQSLSGDSQLFLQEAIQKYEEEQTRPNN